MGLTTTTTASVAHATRASAGRQRVPLNSHTSKRPGQHEQREGPHERRQPEHETEEQQSPAAHIAATVRDDDQDRGQDEEVEQRLQVGFGRVVHEAREHSHEPGREQRDPRTEQVAGHLGGEQHAAHAQHELEEPDRAREVVGNGVWNTSQNTTASAAG